MLWQREKGENGTEHLQGVVVFNTSIRLSALKNLCARAHWEPRLGTQAQAETYCSKDSTRVEGPWTVGDPPAQGQRTDLLEAVEYVKTHTINELAINHSCTFVKFHRGLTALKCAITPPRNEQTKAICFFGPTGTGKSHTVSSSYPSAYWLPQGKWFDGYSGHSVVIIDEFYGWLPFSFILRLLDKYPLLVETKGGHVQFTSRLVVFTSNNPPWEWYPNVQYKAPLRRRFEHVYRLYEQGVQPEEIGEWPTDSHPPVAPTVAISGEFESHVDHYRRASCYSNCLRR